MGCDIHWFIETRVDGVWKATWPTEWSMIEDEAESPREVELAREAGFKIFATYADEQAHLKATGRNHSIWEEDLYVGRNYDNFSVLAGVRGPFLPKYPPRGMPKDVSPQIQFEHKRWGGDAHTPSYLTLEELRGVTMPQHVRRNGWVGVLEYIRFKIWGVPNGWAGNVWGPPKLSNEEMDELPEVQEILSLESVDAQKAAFGLKFEGVSKGKTTNAVTSIEWKAEPRFGELTEKVLPAMAKLIPPQGSASDVRAVFWFDN